jgi:hypothetical protein
MTKIMLSVDRIEGDRAILIVGSGGRHYTAEKEQFPNGLKEGDWVIAELEGSTVVSLQLDPDATQAAKARIEEKLKKLRNRSGSR